MSYLSRVFGGVGVCVRCELCKRQHGASNERGSFGKVWCWVGVEYWILRRVTERREISEGIEKNLELELKFAEGKVIHEETGGKEHSMMRVQSCETDCAQSRGSNEVVDAHASVGR